MFPMIRKTIIPLALRPPFLSSRLHHVKLQSLQLSTIADANYKLFDKKFIQVLKSEVQSYKQHIQAKLDEFPMEIEYNPDEEMFKLKSKKNEGDQIMEVSMSRKPINIIVKEEESSENSPSPILRLNVKITNKEENYMKIEVHASVDEIEIRNVTLSDNDGETCIANLDREMPPEVQRCFMNFLAERGINKANIEFLCEYVVKYYGRDEENKTLSLPKHLKTFLKM